VLLLAAVIAPKAVGALPSVVLAAILVSIAWRLWDRWCIGLTRDLFRADDRDAAIRARRNAAIVVTVTAATVLGQPVAGALVGVALSCLVFIMEMSRPIIRRHRDGSQIFSKRIRSQGHLTLLRGNARYTVVLELQGILFFGNADDLASRLKSLEGRARTIILDLKRVTDLDTSGATILKQIAARCRERGITLMVSAIDPKFASLVAQALGPGTLMFPTSTRARECRGPGARKRAWGRKRRLAGAAHRTDRPRGRIVRTRDGGLQGPSETLHLRGGRSFVPGRRAGRQALDPDARLRQRPACGRPGRSPHSGPRSRNFVGEMGSSTGGRARRT
jgi:MFS superfamily sulfate permease-like transporter